MICVDVRESTYGNHMFNSVCRISIQVFSDALYYLIKIYLHKGSKCLVGRSA